MAQCDDWAAAYGPMDGPWLQDEFHHITKDVKHIDHIRIARADDEEEMTRYSNEVDDTGTITTADWDVTSPYTGKEYRMGCDWRD
jgi:hypothetical protein